MRTSPHGHRTPAMKKSYPYQGEVEQDLIQAFKETRKRISKQLPKLPKFVGSYTDFMISISYFHYYPEKDIRTTNRTYYL